MKTGIAYIPGTFPTYKILYAIQEALPATKNLWSRKKVNDLYFLYKDGVIEHNYPIVEPGKFGVKDYIIEKSSFSESDIRVFLYVLYELAKAGDIDQKWWNVKLLDDQSILKDIIPGDVSKSLDKFSGAIKWGSIALLAAGALYFAWPLLKKVRNK